MRPVSVHGNTTSTAYSLYANASVLTAANSAAAVSSAKMPNGGLNLTTSAPSSTAGRLNASSMNANLNLSNLNESSSPGTTNQTKTTGVAGESGSASSRDVSHHSLNTTQLSPIGGRGRDGNTASVHHYRSNAAQYNNVNLFRSTSPAPLTAASVPTLTSRSPAFNSTTFHHNASSASVPNGGLNITGASKRANGSILVPANVSRFLTKSKEAGVKEMISSLALLCLVSLLLGLLSLVLLLEMSPVSQKKYSDLRRQKTEGLSTEEIHTVFGATRALCSLSLCLNLCCLLVCSVQFFFAVKLVRGSHGRTR